MQTKSKTTAKTTKAATKAPVKRAPAKAASAPKSADNKQAEREALATRIAGERQAANTLFAQLDKASVSVPVKTLSAYKRTYKPGVTAHAIGRKPTIRQAAAIAVACLSNKAKLADGETFSRKFDKAGATYAIENGALSDALSSGLVTYDAATETLTIANAAEIKTQLGSTLKTFAA